VDKIRRNKEIERTKGETYEEKRGDKRKEELCIPAILVQKSKGGSGWGEKRVRKLSKKKPSALLQKYPPRKEKCPERERCDSNTKRDVDRDVFCPRKRNQRNRDLFFSFFSSGSGHSSFYYFPCFMCVFIYL
jgi:hypothetical protein